MQYNTTIKKVCPTKSIKKSDTHENILTFSIILIMGCILFDSSTYAISVTNGLKLFFSAVLPGLLPFMFLCKILSNFEFKKLSKISSHFFKPLFGINGNCFYPFFMSIVSGYPIGAKITSDMFTQGKIDQKEVFKVAILSSTSGLIFVIGTVGQNMLKSTKFGLLIYFSNIFSAILCVLFLNLFQNFKQKRIQSSLSKQFQKEKIKKSEFNFIKNTTSSTKITSQNLFENEKLNLVCQTDFQNNDSKNKNTKFFNKITSSKNKIKNNLINDENKHSTFSQNIQNENTKTKKEKSNILKIITSSAKETTENLLIVCFYISFFSVIIDILTNTNILNFLSSPLKFLLGSIPEKIELSSGVMSGIVEMTRGIKILSSTSSTLSICMISFLISFGGLSIIFQSMSFLSNTNIKFSKFIFAKFFQAILSFFLCLLLLLIF